MEAGSGTGQRQQPDGGYGRSAYDDQPYTAPTDELGHELGHGPGHPKHELVQELGQPDEPYASTGGNGATNGGHSAYGWGRWSSTGAEDGAEGAAGPLASEQVNKIRMSIWRDGPNGYLVRLHEDPAHHPEYPEDTETYLDLGFSRFRTDKYGNAKADVRIGLVSPTTGEQVEFTDTMLLDDLASQKRIGDRIGVYADIPGAADHDWMAYMGVADRLLNAVRTDGQNRDTSRHLVATVASAITMLPVKWLWDMRLPVGCLHLLGGREGVGKSQVWAWLVAHLTKGTLPGEFEGTPRSVIVVATEDSWSHVIVPRLAAAGADLDRVVFVQAVAAEGFDSTLMLPQDNEQLERLIEEHRAVMVVLDPLLSRLDAGLDSHKDAEVRRALEPLAAMADRTRCAFLGLIHVNKSGSDDPLSALMASRAFPAVARAVLFMVTDPDDDTKRLLGEPKNQYGRSDLPTMAGHIEGGIKVADSDEGPVLASRIVWDGESDLSIRQVMAEGREIRGATSEAMIWLEDYLKAGRRSRKDVVSDGRAAGHGEMALRRAGDRLHVVSDHEGFPRVAYWRLPGQSDRSSPFTDGESERTERTERTDAVGSVGSVGSSPPRDERTGDLWPETPGWSVPR